MADNVNVMQTESGLSGRQRRRVKDRRSSLRTRSVESWPSLRAEGQQQSKNILHVCPGAEWRKLKRILWCGVARCGGISRTTNVLYVLNSLLPPHSDERQETRETGQETRNKRREAPRQHPHVPHSAGEAGSNLRKKINTVRPFLDTGIAER